MKLIIKHEHLFIILAAFCWENKKTVMYRGIRLWRCGQQRELWSIYFGRLRR